MVERLLPSPKSVLLQDGKILIPFTAICDYAPWQGHLATLQEVFFKLFRKEIKEGKGGVRLSYDPALLPGHYRIDTTESEAVLAASDDEGILYAIASFYQLVLYPKKGGSLQMENGKIKIEKAVIEDWPEKDFRGIMVDLARQWHPARTVHCYIDICFMLKIRYLHLHFMDNQSYTLPTKAFPKAHGDKRFYSYEDIASFNEHAKKRGIILIPEVEAPGHARALNEAYPEIFSNEMEGDSGVMISEAGEEIDAGTVICPGSQKAVEGIGTILKEVCELFPDSPYIHIGGDEANINAWNYCTKCKAYMKEHGIENVGELYSDFVGQTARAVLELGRTPIVWEGFPKEGTHRIPKETIVIAWESHYHLAPDLLKAGFKIINCSWQPLYIVPSLLRRWNFSDILSWSMYRWTHFWEKSPAKLNPIHVEPTDQVWGGELAVWECTYEQEISRVIENLPALSERTWTVERKFDDDTFRLRLMPMIKLLTWIIQED